MNRKDFGFYHNKSFIFYKMNVDFFNLQFFIDDYFLFQAEEALNVNDYPSFDIHLHSENAE